MCFFVHTMKYIAAHLLVALSGATPDAASISKVLKAGDCEADDAKVKSLLAAVEGKDINEVIAEGMKKIGSVSLGGGGGGGGAAAPAAGAAAAAPAAAAAAPVEEEEDDDMGFGLFD